MSNVVLNIHQPTTTDIRLLSVNNVKELRDLGKYIFIALSRNTLQYVNI